VVVAVKSISMFPLGNGGRFKTAGLEGE
jgi:hypothetical protein